MTENPINYVEIHTPENTDTKESKLFFVWEDILQNLQESLQKETFSQKCDFLNENLEQGVILQNERVFHSFLNLLEKHEIIATSQNIKWNTISDPFSWPLTLQKENNTIYVYQKWRNFVWTQGQDPIQIGIIDTQWNYTKQIVPHDSYYHTNGANSFSESETVDNCTIKQNSNVPLIASPLDPNKNSENITQNPEDLSIETPVLQVSETEVQENIDYTIQKNDTLYRIIRSKYWLENQQNTDVANILSFLSSEKLLGNITNTNQIRPWQNIQLPKTIQIKNKTFTQKEE